MQKRSALSWTILIFLALAIKVFSFFPELVEQYYSTGFYPLVAGLQRRLFGWIPFSIGDLLYLCAGVYLLWKTIIFARVLVKKQLTRSTVMYAAKRVVFTCLIIYIVFNILWGLNYNRVPMTEKMGLPMEKYSTSNLCNIVQLLVGKLNAYDSTMPSTRPPLTNRNNLFHEAVNTYKLSAREYPALTYRFTSVKPSLFGYLSNYMGFTGYYNPFSGEAQANTTVPAFVQPFTACHEIGHQLGYAKENEANFAGFLAARKAPDPYFQYSLYFDLYTYAIHELRMRDSTKVKGFNDQLHQHVKYDFRTYRLFYKQYENPLEPIIRHLYGRYLEANEQPEGLRSYNEVVAMLLAYYKKNGVI